MIREFKQSDLDQALNIWLNASIKAHDFVPKEFWKSKIDDMRNIYFPMGETYIYEENGIIKGFVALCDDLLAAIFVSPNVQGKGIGKQLMNKAKQIRKSLKLSVYKENKNSIEFYKKCGFNIVKEQTDEHTGHPELLMEFNSTNFN
jgi:putative acetyltransferase